MPADLSKFAERIHNAYYLWFTTVRADGTPQPTPVWFIYENGTFLLYTIPNSQKVKNIRHNNKVALSLSEDAEGEKYFVIMGEAAVDDSTPSPDKNTTYLAKYGQGILNIDMTVESFTNMFSLPLRITPTAVRGDNE
ncbi:MAG: TIGR03667 family PPOX class F420-dependent oxidoreductase [Anaerolineae bacterium]